MKTIVKKDRDKAAFTIVELLTVMSIIIILISLLVPALNKVKSYAKEVRQKAQFHSINVAMELFLNEHDGYPPSDADDEDDKDYCGAMKLAEAMMGQDLLGFYPDSHYRRDGLDRTGGTQLYPNESDVTAQEYKDNLSTRRGPYLQLENASAYKIGNIYGKDDVGPFINESLVLCDVYSRIRLKPLDNDDKVSGKVGMPILYYRADTSNNLHDPNVSDLSDNIYNYEDNEELVKLGKPWLAGASHRMYETPPEKFYEKTKNPGITTSDRPYRSDSYILLSAGFDGDYGTADDIFNFRD